MAGESDLRAIVSIVQEIDEAFERFFGSDEPAVLWSPPIDLFVSDRTVHLFVEIPGVAPRDLEIRVSPRTVVVRGLKPMPAQARRGVNFYECEILYGWFEKRVALPSPVNPDRFTIEMKDGILDMELERASITRVVRVE
jgi:HSP20 family protein